MNSLIHAYKDLLFRFTGKKEISAIQFEKEFLILFKSDESCDENSYEIIKPLFYAVEDFCSNPALREKDDIDESQLAEAAQKTLFRLEELSSIDQKSLRNGENKTDMERLTNKFHDYLNHMPLLIEEIIEKKLNDVLPKIVKNALSEELHKLTPRR